MCGGWGVPEDDELSPDEGGCGKKKVTAAGIDKSKRGFTTAAMASPVLMSLLSKPAWSDVACSISGLTSGNVSSPGGLPGPCGGSNGGKGHGCTPGFWKNNPVAWGATGYSPGKCKDDDYKGNSSKCDAWDPTAVTGMATTFTQAFICSPPSLGVGVDASSLMEILQVTVKVNGNKESYDTANHAMQAHWVAALLNASAAPGLYGSTADQVINAVCQVIDTTASFTSQELHATLELMNERGCVFDAHGDYQMCGEEKLKNDEGECIPACVGDAQFDVNTGQCIPMGSWRADTHCSIQDFNDDKCGIDTI